MFIIDDLDLEIWMTLERVQSLDNGNLIGQISASRPSGPITAKLNLTRIYEYKVFIHIKQNQVLNGEKDLTCQWFKKKQTKNLWDQMKRSETLSWRTPWRDCLKNMNASLVFMNINRNFSNMVSEHLHCTLYWPDHFGNTVSNLGLHFKRDNDHLENAQEMQPGG